MALLQPGFFACEPEDFEDAPFLELVAAARSGDVARLVSLLEQGVPTAPRRPLPSSLNPVAIEAALAGQRDVLEELLARDAECAQEVDVALGAAPLHWACMRGDWGSAHLLLSRGASLEAATREGLLPLHCAAAHGHRGLLELLLERGAPVDARVPSTRATALLLTAEGGFVHCIEPLLRAGADVNAVDAERDTALLVAARRGFSPLVAALLESGALVDAANEAGVTPLMAASFFGRVPVMRALLDRGASVSRRDAQRQRTALHWGAAAGEAGAVAALLAAHADAGAADAAGRTARDLAGEIDAEEVLLLLG